MLKNGKPVYVEEIDMPFLIPTRVLNLEGVLLDRICDFIIEKETKRSRNRERVLNNISKFFELENDQDKFKEREEFFYELDFETLIELFNRARPIKNKETNEKVGYYVEQDFLMASDEDAGLICTMAFNRRAFEQEATAAKRPIEKTNYK